MGKCKECGAEIEDGQEYCESCLLLKDFEMEGNSGKEDLSSEDGSDFEFLDELNIDKEFLNNLGEEDAPFALDDSAISDEEDVFSIDQVENTEEKEKEGRENLSDVGDILSDALGVLSDTEDKEDNGILAEPEAEKEEKQKQKGEKGLLKKLFGNLESDSEETEQDDEKLEKLEEEKKKAKEDKKKKKAEVKEAKKKAAAEKKQARAAKKKEKASLRQEAEKEIPIDHGKINKVGAAIVFLFFSIITGLVVVGTNTFTYAQSINSAKNYFRMQKYEKAYDEIAGMTIKTKDENTYDKITTVMIVQKQLDSYENYYNLKMYPEALDSLIKGVKRYDAFISKAESLNVDSDLDSIRDTIMGKLEKSFGLSESDVSALLKIDSQDVYSKKIYQLSEEN